LPDSTARGLTRLTLIPWQGGKPLTWDVTVVSTLADSYLHSVSHSVGSTAETASNRKEIKYSSLPPDFIFQPVAIETLGLLSASALNFLSEVGRRLTSLSRDSCETSFLFQRPLNAHTALQLCSDYGLFLLL